MNAADVLCLTSRNEGLPNVVLEALASGLPVVATQCGRDCGGCGCALERPLVRDAQPSSDIAAAVLAVAGSADREQIARRCARSWAAAAADYHQTLVS